MITIRNGTFETNSSSTHSIVICSKKDIKLWEKGELLGSRDDNKLVKKEDAVAELKRDYPEYFDEEGNFVPSHFYKSIDDALSYILDLKNINRWVGELESESTYYTTDSGEELVIMCRYGYDG